MNMNEIIQLRKEVNRIDKRTLELFAERLELAKKIAEKKQNAGLPVIDREREEQLKEVWELKVKELGLEVNSISSIFEEVLNMSRQIQSKVMK